MDITTYHFIDDFYKVNKKYKIPGFLKRWNLNSNICELGVREGINFRCLLQSEPKQIYGIDIYKDDGIFSHNDVGFTQKQQDGYYEEMKKLEASDNRVKIIRDFSMNAVNLFEDNFFDFVYIDADHSYEAISQDLKCWYKKVKNNGILSGHDYVMNTHKETKYHLEGVRKAVDEFLKENNIKYFHLTSEKCASWMIIKEF